MKSVSLKKLHQVRGELKPLKVFYSTFRSKLMFDSEESVGLPLRRARLLIGTTQLSSLRNDQVKELFERVISTTPTEHTNNCKETLKILESISKQLGGVLGRVQVVSLTSYGNVPEHIDIGSYYALHERYHLVVDSEKSEMVVNKKIYTFKSGDIFYLENRLPHSAKNETAQERVHIIFDILPKSFFKRILRLFGYWVSLKKTGYSKVRPIYLLQDLLLSSLYLSDTSRDRV